MTNRQLPHVMVLPEDDANRQLVNGFLLDPSVASRRIQVLAVAGGWTKLLDHFLADHVSYMERYPNRYMVLLIDFDGQIERLAKVKAVIPDHLSERVFVLGALHEPEELRSAIGSYETIGLAMAEDCRKETVATWGHELLRHNASELDRLREHVRPILFSSI